MTPLLSLIIFSLQIEGDGNVEKVFEEIANAIDSALFIDAGLFTHPNRIPNS